MLPALAEVDVKLAPEATAIMAASERMKRALTSFRGEACQRAEMRCMEGAWFLSGRLGSGPLSASRPQSLDSETRMFVQRAPPLDAGSVHEAALHGPAAELVAVGELQLSQHCGDVRLHRLGRDMEPGPDLLVEVGAGGVLEDPAPARGELVELGVDGRGSGAAPAREGVEHEARQARGEDRVAVGDPAHGVGELGP